LIARIFDREDGSPESLPALPVSRVSDIYGLDEIGEHQAGEKQDMIRALGRRISLKFESLAGPETATQFVRFLAVGITNTIVGCAVYLLFVNYVSHTLAYGFAFIAGTACAASLHARVTYRVPLKTSSFTLTALFYLVSYLANAAILEITVVVFGVDKRLGILAVVVASIPITFIATRFIYKGIR
jgi:putative flippase GtrA